MSDSSDESFDPSHGVITVTRPQGHVAKRKERYASRSRRGESKGGWFTSKNIKIFVALLLCIIIPVVYKSSSQLPSQTDVQNKLASWMPGRQLDEITIPRDTRTRQWGFQYTDNLILSSVTEGSPARALGLQKFLSRRITHANGVSVLTAENFNNIESHIGDSITLQFAPSAFVVGSAVVVAQRVVFRSGVVVEKGTQGVVVSVPGKLDGSVATIKSPDVGLWDALPGQVEPVEEEVKLVPGMTIRTVRTVVFQSGKRLPSGSVGVVSKVPGEYVGSVAEVTIGGLKWDAMPGQIQVVDVQSAGKSAPPPTLATEEVVNLLEALGHQQYLPRLVSFGLDRLDFLALSSKRDGIMLGIKPVHWKRIVLEARHRVPLSGRGRSGLEQLCSDLGEKQLLPKLVSYGLDRLDQVAKTEPRDGQALKIKPEQWTRIVTEAKKRMNMTSNSLEQPQTAAHQVLFRLLQDVGLSKHYKRFVVFGLDSLERVANSQNISATIDLQGWEWDRIVKEAQRRQSGKGPTRYANVDPESEKEHDMAKHEELARQYDEEDNKRTASEVTNPTTSSFLKPRPSAHAHSMSVVDSVVGGATKREQEEREKLSQVIQHLSGMGLKERASLLGNERLLGQKT